MDTSYALGLSEAEFWLVVGIAVVVFVLAVWLISVCFDLAAGKRKETEKTKDTMPLILVHLE